MWNFTDLNNKSTMATTIEQRPLFTYLAAGQEIIFTVANDIIVTNVLNSRVKFVAEVRVSGDQAPNPSSSSQVIGTFKTTPNNAARGIFDFRPIIENFVKSDNMARSNSTFKTAANTELITPIHLIDKFSGNNNNFKYFTVKFKIEYFNGTSLVTTTGPNSPTFKVWNGYIKYDDEIAIGNGTQANWFGYNLTAFNLTDSTKRFLTNAPDTQFANIEDYGTLSMLNIASVYKDPTGGLLPGVRYVVFRYYDINDVQLDADTVGVTDVNDGGFNFSQQLTANNQLTYLGAFPGNLRGWSTKFNANIKDISYYTISVQKYTGAVADIASRTYRININCPTLKGYAPIRLCWLNQWGAWDYYTFTMKSIKKTKAKGTTYRQLAGSWNSEVYKMDAFKGGKKAFRVNATEMITMNTDFVNESESEWFEELINSPEVYILEGYRVTLSNSSLNTTVTPVRLSTSSYTKKTVANDKLMQYTFEVEKSKTLRTQSV